MRYWIHAPPIAKRGKPWISWLSRDAWFHSSMLRNRKLVKEKISRPLRCIDGKDWSICFHIISSWIHSTPPPMILFTLTAEYMKRFSLYDNSQQAQPETFMSAKYSTGKVIILNCLYRTIISGWSRFYKAKKFQNSNVLMF